MTCQKRNDTWGGEVAIDQIKSSPRVERLRDRYLNWKGRVGYETALHWTQAFKESEGEPRILRRAKAFKKLLENKSLPIHPDELIVGGIDCRPHSSAQYPDMNVMWMENELDTFPPENMTPLKSMRKLKKYTGRKYSPTGEEKPLRKSGFKWRSWLHRKR